MGRDAIVERSGESLCKMFDGGDCRLRKLEDVCYIAYPLFQSISDARLVIDLFAMPGSNIVFLNHRLPLQNAGFSFGSTMSGQAWIHHD